MATVSTASAVMDPTNNYYMGSYGGLDQTFAPNDGFDSTNALSLGVGLGAMANSALGVGLNGDNGQQRDSVKGGLSLNNSDIQNSNGSPSSLATGLAGSTGMDMAGTLNSTLGSMDYQQPPQMHHFGYPSNASLAGLQQSYSNASTPSSTHSPQHDTLERSRGRSMNATAGPSRHVNNYNLQNDGGEDMDVRSNARMHPYGQVEKRKADGDQLDASNGQNSAARTAARSGRAGIKRRQKYSRTRTGCLCCRARRIKCDEERPTCRRCIIAKKECQYPEGESNPNSRENSREDVNRGKVNVTSRSSTEDLGTDEDSTARLSALHNAFPLQNTYHDPYNLATASAVAQSLPPVDDKNGIVAPSDFAWDTSSVTTTIAPGMTDGVNTNNILELVSPGVTRQPTKPTSLPPVQTASQMNLQQQQNTQMNSAHAAAPMLTTPNFLLPWFPTQEERSLILHYCANAADLMMAIPSGINPMLAINLPLALDSPRGMNPAADSLRIALLGIGAIHQAFLLTRSGVSNHQTSSMFRYASNLRDIGKDMVRKAALEGSGAASDAALGAGTSLALSDILFGGAGWQDNFSLMKELVKFRGGPAAMLKQSTPKQLSEGVTISPARVMLEILAIYETMGCLASGEEPFLLNDKGQDWWFETSQSTYETHSTENQFGMSRVMIHLFSRLVRLLSRLSRSKVRITELDSPGDVTLAPEPKAETPDPSDVNPTAASPGKRGQSAEEILVKEARSLNDDVDAWISSLQLRTLEHERVQVGNRAYAYTMKILLLRRVFGYGRDDQRVQDAASEVLRHCSVCTAVLGMSIDLSWPAIIAGSCMTTPESRSWILTLLEGFKAQCCFDVDTASNIIKEVWRRVDSGSKRADWKEVCEDFHLNILIC